MLAVKIMAAALGQNNLETVIGIINQISILLQWPCNMESCKIVSNAKIDETHTLRS